MQSINIKEIFNEEKVGKEVFFKGWVYRRRIVGNKVFLVIRDANSIIQVVIKDDELLKKIQPIQIEGSFSCQRNSFKR
jgi:asparaginyl-tRNA synthetase